MATPVENVDKGNNLIDQAKQSGRCLDLAGAVDDDIDNLRKASKFKFTEWLALVGIVGGAIAGSFMTGGLGAIALIGLAGAAAYGVMGSYWERVGDANKKLEKSIEKLKKCLG